MVDIFGGTITFFVRILNSSIFNMKGGYVNIIESYDNSIINLSGGYVKTVDSYENSIYNLSNEIEIQSLIGRKNNIINITGGTINRLGADYSSVINLYNANITGWLCGNPSSIINIYAYNFNYNPIGGVMNGGYITGNWFNGEPFIIDLFMPETYSHINVIPEPSTLLLLGLGGIFAFRRRRL